MVRLNRVQQQLRVIIFHHIMHPIFNQNLSSLGRPIKISIDASIQRLHRLMYFIFTFLDNPHLFFTGIQHIILSLFQIDQHSLA